MFNIPRNGGLIKAIIIIVIALLILSFLGINLRGLINSPTTQDNFSYAWNSVVYVWNTYLKAPVSYAYGLFIMYIWDPAINNLMHKAATGQLNIPLTSSSSSTY